jgi:hypothetical protein
MPDMSSQWYSIEVLDGATAASLWSEIFGDSLVNAALGCGATDWNWHRHSWGVVFEVEFADEDAWDRYRASLSVERALDAAPDPVHGVIVYKGRGGSSGSRQPRPRRPLIGSGAAALPLPFLEDWDDQVFPAPPRALVYAS